MNNNEKLIALAASENMTRSDVAEFLHVSVHTVNAWYAGDESGCKRLVPRNVFELLQYKLKYGKL